MKPKGSFLSVKTLTRKIDCWCLFMVLNTTCELASGQVGLLLRSFIDSQRNGLETQAKALMLLMLHP